MSQDSKSEKLLIKKFRTENTSYIYSTATNEISAVDTDIWNSIDQFGQGKNSEDVDEFIQEVVDSGLWSSKQPEIRVGIQSIEQLYAEFKNSGIQQLILNLTNQCNMRCRYCTFSGNYKYERTHENRHMSYETACKAVDFFFRNGSSEENRAITFYGGEVLSRFELLKKVVAYARGIDPEVRISFTTNGTLLSEGVVKYLIDKDIAVNISLDGEKDTNDRNRLLMDGTGSFDLIMDNLKRIKEVDEGYFRDRISFISVITPPYELEKLKTFFFNSEFFDLKRGIMANPVSLNGSAQYEGDELLKIHKQLEESAKKMLSGYEAALIDGRADDCQLEQEWFEDLVTGIHFRIKSPVEDVHAPLGQCIPGTRRLFVSVDGKYFMCERVGEHLSIGDVDRGIDLQAILDFYREWEKHFSKCSSCWAVRICKKCFNELHLNGELDESRREKFCDSALRRYELLLETYCRILEKNPDAFKGFSPENYI